MGPYNIMAPLVDQAFGWSHLEFWVTPGQQKMVKCNYSGSRPNQDWSHINVQHMQGVWRPLYAVDVHMDGSLQHYMAPLVDPAFGSHLELWVAPGQQKMVKCNYWVCRPNQDWFHINSKHVQGVWQPSYAVDVHMDGSLQHYSSSCWPSFWKSPRIMGNSWGTNDGEVQCLRL